MIEYQSTLKPIVQLKDQWNPYVYHGGVALALAGEDFVVIGADTRLSFNSSILSRN